MCFISMPDGQAIFLDVPQKPCCGAEIEFRVRGFIKPTFMRSAEFLVSSIKKVIDIINVVIFQLYFLLQIDNLLIG